MDPRALVQTQRPLPTFSRIGRIAAAGTLVIGTGLQLVSWLISAPPEATIDWLRWMADNPTAATAMSICDLLAAPFVVANAVVYALVGRSQSPRLATFGGAILGFGMVGLTANTGLESLEVSLVHQGHFDLHDLALAFDASEPGPTLIFFMFAPFAVVGVALTTAALLRSRALPPLAVLLLPTFLILDILGFGVVAHAVAFMGAAWIGIAIARGGQEVTRSASPSNEQRRQLT